MQLFALVQQEGFVQSFLQQRTDKPQISEDKSRTERGIIESFGGLVLRFVFSTHMAMSNALA